MGAPIRTFIHIGCHLSTTDGYEAISLSMYHTVFDSMDKDGFMEAIDSAIYLE